MRTSSRVRIMIIEDIDLEAKLLTRTLVDGGYSNIVRANNIKEALAELEKSPVRIIIADRFLGEEDGLELVRRLRARGDADYVFIVMLTSRSNDEDLRAAFESGVDDFVAKPYRPDDLLGRLCAGDRIVKLETTLRSRSRELETALRRIDVAAAQRALAKAAEPKAVHAPSASNAMDALLTSDGWQGLESILTKAVGEFFQLPFSPAGVRKRHGAFVAEISLAEPVKGLAIDLDVVMERDAMDALATHLLGASDPESAEAIVLELANLLMGSIKTTCLEYGFNFIGGIPAPAVHGVTESAFEASNIRSRFAVGHDASTAEIWIRASEKSNRTVKARALREGYVVSDDVRDPRGMLLIRGGTRLTQSTAERLAKLAPDIDICVSDLSAAA